MEHVERENEAVVKIEVSAALLCPASRSLPLVLINVQLCAATTLVQFLTPLRLAHFYEVLCQHLTHALAPVESAGGSNEEALLLDLHRNNVVEMLITVDTDGFTANFEEALQFDEGAELGRAVGNEHAAVT